MIRVLLEGRDAPLYHSTSLESAYKILKSNVFRASTSRGDSNKVVCFTRDKEYWIANNVVRFTIDQRKLSQNYRLTPFDYDELKLKSTSGTRIFDYQYEAEERVVARDIKNADRYITEIEINPLVAMEILSLGEDSILVNAVIDSDYKKPHPMDPYGNSGLILILIDYARKHNIGLGKDLSKLAKVLDKKKR